MVHGVFCATRLWWVKAYKVLGSGFRGQAQGFGVEGRYDAMGGGVENAERMSSKRSGGHFKKAKSGCHCDSFHLAWLLRNLPSILSFLEKVIPLTACGCRA